MIQYKELKKLRDQGRELYEKSKQPKKHSEIINTQMLIALIYSLWNRSSSE